MADTELEEEEVYQIIRESLEGAFREAVAKRKESKKDQLRIKLEYAGDKRVLVVKRPVDIMILKAKVKDLYKTSLLLYFCTPNAEAIHVNTGKNEESHKAVLPGSVCSRMRRHSKVSSSGSKRSITDSILEEAEFLELPSDGLRSPSSCASSRRSVDSCNLPCSDHSLCMRRSVKTKSKHSTCSDDYNYCINCSPTLPKSSTQSENGDESPTSHSRCQRRRMFNSGRHYSKASSSSSSGLVADLSPRDFPDCCCRSTCRSEHNLSPKTPTNWRQGKTLGTGAFGHVFLCYDTETGREFAVKRVNVNTFDPCQAKEAAALEREISTLKSLNHENIVQYIGCQCDQESVFIFMEYMPGGSVKDEIRQYGPLTEIVTKKYTKQVLRGLAHLHSNDYVHRDIKSANILRDPSGIVKIADFGASKRLQAICTQSATGTFVGTSYYMAPEVVNGQHYGRKADIWSLACTAIEMLTGSPPWKELEPMAALLKIITQEPQYILPQETSPEFASFIQRLFTRDPKERPSADDALSDPLLSSDIL